MPQSQIFVKLKKGISDEQRTFIGDGIRSLFKSEQTFFINVHDEFDLLDNAFMSLDIFILLVALISIALTFFLLLVSTRQNVKDNIWEYGVLRSIGFTMAQGKRLYMYEAFIVVTAAVICGIIVGVIVASLISAQFCLFIELPMFVDFNWWIIVAILIITLFTTFFAVWIPISNVNERSIGSVLSASD